MLFCTKLGEQNSLCPYKFALSRTDSFTTLIFGFWILAFEISKVVGQ